VITPLLALLLGDGEQLVMQCVPAALLEMSRAVMRALFQPQPQPPPQPQPQPQP